MGKLFAGGLQFLLGCGELLDVLLELRLQPSELDFLHLALNLDRLQVDDTLLQLKLLRLRLRLQGVEVQLEVDHGAVDFQSALLALDQGLLQLGLLHHLVLLVRVLVAQPLLQHLDFLGRLGRPLPLLYQPPLELVEPGLHDAAL